jgi:hypothetical protein
VFGTWGILGLLAVATPVLAGDQPDVSWQAMQDEDSRVAVIEGLSGPEAVRYDPGQDVYFVSNFNGEASGDANGFISRVAPNGSVETLKFMVGTGEHPLHGPRGMQIVGDTLWVADAAGVHGFDRESGRHTDFIDFTGHEPGFLNDIDAAPDGTLYVTDTGDARVFRIREGEVAVVASDGLAHPPNGITWYDVVQGYVLAPWNEGLMLQSYRPEDGALVEIGNMPDGGDLDGIEEYAGRLLIASQVDQAIWAWRNGGAHKLIETTGRPADIGIDTKRGRIAVPYIALDRVDIWQLPSQ